ncbi:MAG: Wzz/FepE/Etk N-terminal domain-containing protein [Candidatus Contendobacter sp.]|nr:Wzz/FepE/Etk N-terminal domain-containing protein [Candidatus Contendobacter sp.]
MNTPGSARDEVKKIEPATAPLPYGLEEEIELVEYLASLFRNKYWILLFAVLCAGAGFGLAKVIPKRYEAGVQLSLRQPDIPGGVTPDNRRASEMLTLMEHGFVLDMAGKNYRDVVMAQMNSRNFTSHFIATQNVLPYLFAKQWNPDKQEWIGGFKPSLNEAYEIFDKSIRTVVHDPETDLIRLIIRWRDPEIAATWANAYVKAFNDFTREKDIQESRRKREFLMQELRETSVVEMEKSIYRMIEAETAVEMLARSRENYVLLVLDNAVPDARHFTPSVIRMTAIGFAAGFGMGFVAAIGSVLVRKIRNAMQAYQARAKTNGEW